MTAIAGLIAQSALAASGGVLVGLALALTGGGGSIFAMPLLVVGLGIAPSKAVPVALAAVALTALMGAWRAARERLPVWPAAAAFAVGGVLTTPLGVALASRLPERVIVLGFALIALLVATLMAWQSWRRPGDAMAVRAQPLGPDSGGACRLADDGRLRFTAPCASVLLVGGMGTGLLSGLFGVGGGFVIVPALVLVTRMGIHRAVATSLVVLAAIGMAGTASALWQRSLPWPVLLPFVAGGVAGMMAGRALAARLAGPMLQRIFAAAIVVTGAGMALRGWS